MSEHPIPADAEQEIGTLCHRYLRLPDIRIEPNGSRTYIFTPDLSAAEQTRFNRLLAIARSNVKLSPDELGTLLPTLVGLRDYHALPNPTNAQSVAAIKGIIRVLRALLRD